MSRDETEEFRRRPAAAGATRFYPSDPKLLREVVTGYINEAELLGEEEIFGLIAPHAGYVYSGPVAGWAYRQVSGRRYETVIVLAPSHFEPFSFASVMPRGVYRTPLGDVQVDERLAHALSDKGKDWIQLSLQGHTVTGGMGEHSLEVQLPFLQVALGEFKLVPVVIGGVDWELCLLLGQALAEAIDDGDVLVVASSDLSHYHSYDQAYRLDSQVIERVEALDARGLAEGCRSRELEACGAAPISALLTAAELIGAKQVRILRHRTSGDVKGGMRDQVVGYLAAAIYRGEADSDLESADEQTKTDQVLNPGEQGSGLQLTEDDKETLLRLARQALEDTLADDKKGTSSQPATPSSTLNEIRGMFVTLKANNRLRGCIGQLGPAVPLHQLVGQVALQAAFEDPRFPPLSPAELPRVTLEITILGPLRAASRPEEVIPGEHGVLIRRGSQQGLLLPQVATEQGWDRKQLLENTCLKAGLSPDTWRDPETRIMIFTADNFAESSRQ